jgi:hypothetical protein
MIALLLIIFSAPSFAAMTQQEAREGAEFCKMNTSPAQWREQYVNAFNNAWERSQAGNYGATQTDGPRDCEARKVDVEKCCNPRTFNETTCKTHLENLYGSHWASQNPFNFPSEEPQPATCVGGANTSVECQRANLLRSAGYYDRMSGACRALSQACADKCGLPPTAGADAPGSPNNECNVGIKFSESACLTATQNLATRDRLDPNLTSQNPGTPGNTRPEQPGHRPGPPPTQRPGGGSSAMNGLAQGLMMAAPMLAAAMNQQQPAQNPTQVASATSTPQTCEQNPMLAGCPNKVAAGEPWNKKVDAAAPDNTDNEGADGNFNTASTEGGNPPYSGNGGEPKFGSPAASTAVPNGGGQMPGQGGGGGGGAVGGQTTGQFGVASKAATDIMHGMMSGGGYSAMNAGMQLQNGAGGGFSGYGGGPEPFKPGMDLRQFLPHKDNRNRKMAGGAVTFQIQPQTVNIWSRISERFQARCKLGMLRDCDGSNKLANGTAPAGGTRMPASLVPPNKN